MNVRSSHTYRSVDVLFVDEAEQLSRAKVRAIFRVVKAMVLLGDPQQSQQPAQGSHPEVTEVPAPAQMKLLRNSNIRRR